MRVEKTVVGNETPKPEPAVHQPIGKVIALVVLVSASAALFWFSVFKLIHLDFDLRRVTGSLLGPIVFFGASFGFFLGVAGLCFNLFERFWPRLVASALAGFVTVAFFPVTGWLLAAALLAAVAMLQWAQAVHTDVRSRQKITIVRSMMAGLGFTVMLFLISIALVYYASLTNGDERTQTFRTNLVDGATELMHQALEKNFRGYHPKMTLDEFIVNFGVSGLEQSLGGILTEQKEAADKEVSKVKDVQAPSGLPPEFEKLFKDYQSRAPGELIPQAAIDEALKKAEGQVVAQLRQQILEAFGIQALGTETMDVVLHRLVDVKVGALLGPYLKFLPAFLAVSVYLALQIFSVIYMIIGRLIAVLLYSLLRLVRFLRIETVQVPAQRLRL